MSTTILPDSAAPEVNVRHFSAVLTCPECGGSCRGAAMGDEPATEPCDGCRALGVVSVPLCPRCLGVPPRYLPLTDLADGHEACRCAPERESSGNEDRA